METLQTDVLLHMVSWLDIRETLRLFSLSRWHREITRLRKFWLSILKKFWHDLDLSDVHDFEMRTTVINAYREYHQGTHLILYEGQIPYEAMNYVVNVRNIVTSHPDMVVLSKGPRNDGIVKCLRFRKDYDYFFDSYREEKLHELAHHYTNVSGEGQIQFKSNFREVRTTAQMFIDFAFPYLSVECWSVRARVQYEARALIFKGKSVASFYYLYGGPFVEAEERIEVMLIPGTFIGQDVQCFSLDVSISKNENEDRELSIYPDRPMNLCLVKDVGFRCM